METANQDSGRGTRRSLILGGVAALVFLFGFIWILGAADANNVTSKVTVASSVPTISGVTLNNASSVILIAGTTTPISVYASITDANGCNDILNGTATILIYRIGVGSSSCLSGGTNNLNCYVAAAFTATSTCQSSVTINATTTFNMYYFAQATDASSSFPGSGWKATVNVTSAASATSTADSASTTVDTLTAINVTTSTINYGILQANTNTGLTNQLTTSTNAGNSSTTLQLSALATLASGSNSISTSSQHYATTTFTYGGSEQALSASPVSVTGFLLTAPTSTTNVAQAVFWGLAVPNATPTGTYTGTNLFTAVFSN